MYIWIVLFQFLMISKVKYHVNKCVEEGIFLSERGIDNENNIGCCFTDCNVRTVHMKKIALFEIYVLFLDFAFVIWKKREKCE